MIIEFEINGARVIVSGDNLSISVTEDGIAKGVTAIMHKTAVEGEGVEALRVWLKAVRGRAIALANHLGITRPAIDQWREVPADKLVAVEAFTGIKRQVLRPELFEGMPA